MSSDYMEQARAIAPTMWNGFFTQDYAEEAQHRIARALAEAVAAERERCAKVCDDMSGWRDWAELKHPNFPGAPCEAGAAADWLAEAIRAGAKEGS